MTNADNTRLSRHARKQMKWRRIAVKDVEETISSPDRVEESIKGRKNAFKLIGSKLLKITYKTEKNYDIIVITAMVKGEK
jgi:hypothetical protein